MVARIKYKQCSFVKTGLALYCICAIRLHCLELDVKLERGVVVIYESFFLLDFCSIIIEQGELKGL